MSILKVSLYFIFSYAILCFPFKGTPIFFSLYDITSVYTKDFYDIGEKISQTGINIFKDISTKLFTNAKPEKEVTILNTNDDQIHATMSAIQKTDSKTDVKTKIKRKSIKIIGRVENSKPEKSPLDDYTPEEEALLQRLIESGSK